MKTYRVRLFTRTSKGKTNYLDDIFVSSEDTKKELSEFYQEKYKPIGTDVSEVETVKLELPKKDKYPIEKINSGNMYSDPEYRISRKTLPKEVEELIKKLEANEKENRDIKSSINKALYPYFNRNGSFSGHDRENIKVRGYMAALGMRKRDEE